MDDNSIIEDLSRIYNLIVGYWHAEKENHTAIFSLTESPISYAPLVLINNENKTENTFYCIVQVPQIDTFSPKQYYIEIGKDSNSIRYLIVELSGHKLIIRMFLNFDSLFEYNDIIYLRKINQSFVNKVLKEFD